MPITPIVFGSGRAGEAIAKSLACLNILRPDLKLLAPLTLKRGTPLIEAMGENKRVLVCIANPHGLHADAIIEANAANVSAILCEKPACINLQQVVRLRETTVKTAVLHGYRLSWGVQSLKQLIETESLGNVFSIEGRYWQSSAAEKALQPTSNSLSANWKNDIRLSGQSDAYLDLGTHMADSISFLYGENPTQIKGWRSYANAESAHRDSHAQLSFSFSNGRRGYASVSKNVHGATNQFEVTVLGTKGSASWSFLNPDEIWLGEGRNLRRITRQETSLGSGQAPYHAMGWLEGYIEIAHRLIEDAFFAKPSQYPNLQDNLNLLEVMLSAAWE